MKSYRHKKSGHVVRVIGEGKMQTDGLLGDMAPVVIYTHQGNIWVRPVEEFKDGRFEETPG